MKFLASLFLLISFVLASNGQQSAAAAASITEFDVGGLKVIFKRRTSSPTISAGLFVRGGVRNQIAATAGLESLTLAAAMEGSKKFPRDVLRKELSRTGTAIGASSGTDFGVMSVTSTAGEFARSWNVFTSLVLDPAFAPEDVNRVREGMLVGLRNASASPESALGQLEEKIVFAGHPYAVPAEGTIENITKFTPADLRAYHKKLLETSRLLLVVVGDADPAQIKQLVTASFASLPKGTYTEAQLPRIMFDKSSLDITSRSTPTNYVKGVFQAPTLSDPDYYAMRVAMAILQSRVYQEVRVRRNLSYAPDAGMGDLAANTANISVSAVDANQSVGVMLAVIADLKANPVEREEFDTIPAYFLTTHFLELETNVAQAGDLGRYEMTGGGWRNSQEFIDRIRKVTPADVQAVAQKYMKNIRFVVVGDPSAINRTVFIPN